MNKKIQLISGIMAISASMVMGAVTVNFSNSIPIQTENVIQKSLLLAFNVDSTGNVTMDASSPQSAQQPVQNAIKAWAGPVGKISYAGAFNTTFTLELSQRGG